MMKPRILFALGDIDWKYSRGKLRHVMKRVAAAGPWDVSVVSHDQEICRELEGEVPSFHMPGSFPGVLPEHALAMSDIMIRYTSDVLFPDSRFPFWKTMATDDFVGCFTPSSHPQLPFHPDLVVYPLMGIDNSTIGACHFYTEVVRQAHGMSVPVLGFEVSPLGDRQSLGASLADYYVMKTEFSRSFIVNQELAPEEQVFVMPPLENYLLTCRNDSLLDDFFPVENGVRRSLGLPAGHVTIFLPHNVAFVYETRQILAALAAVQHPIAVLIGVSPDVARHSRKEREIAEIVYRDEIAKLPCVLMCEERGWRELLMVSDIVVGPNYSVHAELASHYEKLTIISQPMGERAWIGENFYAEPDAGRIAGLIDGWIDHRWRRRMGFAEIVKRILERRSASKREVKIGSQRQKSFLLHRP